MERTRWSATLVLALVAAIAACGPNPPAQPTASQGPSVKKSTKPATPATKGPPATPTGATPTPTATGTGAPTPTPTGGPTTPTGTTPATTAPTPAPTSLATSNPTLVALGCRTAGTSQPVPAIGGAKPKVAAVYGHGSVPGLAVSRNGTAVTLKAPAPVDVVVMAYPGSPGTLIAAYQVTLKTGATEGTVVASPVKVGTPLYHLGAAADTHFGKPVAIPVALPVGRLKPALVDAATAPAVVRAEVTFFDEKGAAVLDKDLKPLTATIPLALAADATPAALSPADACPAPTPTPYLPPALTPVSGVVPATLEWKEVAPAAVVRSAAGVLTQTNVGIAIAAPPGSPGGRIDSFEATYEFQSEADAKLGKPPTKTGPTVTNLSTPILVAAATATAYSPSAFATLPFATDAIKDLKGAEGVVTVTFVFKNEANTAIVDAAGNPFKVTVPLLIE